MEGAPASRIPRGIGQSRVPNNRNAFSEKFASVSDTNRFADAASSVASVPASGVDEAYPRDANLNGDVPRPCQERRGITVENVCRSRLGVPVPHEVFVRRHGFFQHFVLTPIPIREIPVVRTGIKRD